jgi:hypothetical protein
MRNIKRFIKRKRYEENTPEKGGNLVTFEFFLELIACLLSLTLF